MQLEDTSTEAAPGAGALVLRAQGRDPLGLLHAVRRTALDRRHGDEPEELLTLAGTTVARGALAAAIDGRVLDVHGEAVAAAAFAAFFAGDAGKPSAPGAKGASPMSGIRPAPATADDKPREVFLSYAWGDDSPAGRLRAQAVDRLQAALAAEGYAPVRDRDRLRPGERISAFIRRLTGADLVVAVISDKYLRSPYCMYEIYRLWQRCQADPDELVERIVPVILPEVRIGSFEQRAPYMAFWSERAAKLAELVRDPALRPSRESWEEVRLVQEFAHHVDGILGFLNDVLMPRNLDAQLADDFAAVREAVRRLAGRHAHAGGAAPAQQAAEVPAGRRASRSTPAAGGAEAAEELRILWLAANLPAAPLDLEAEARSLEAELRSVRFRDRITLAVRHAVRPDDLVRHVRAVRPHVVHFSGHGSPGGIRLRDDGDGVTEVGGAALRRFLAGRGVEVLVLNACYTSDLGAAAGAAVGAVVGTTGTIGDEQARRFATAFHRGIGEGLSLREAFRDGGDAVVLHGLEDAFWSQGDLERILLR